MEMLPLEPYIADLSEDAALRLKSSLARTARGSGVDLVTPFIPRSEDPNLGRTILRDELLPKVYSKYDWINDAERTQASLIGAYSIQLPYVDRAESVERYFRTPMGNYDGSLLDRAVELFISSLPQLDLSPLPLELAFNHMPTGTALGAPFFTSDKRYRYDVLRVAQYIHRMGWQYDVDPSQLFWRGQPRGIGEIPKQRVVWGYPHYMTIIELSLQEPMLQVLREINAFVAWKTPDDVDMVVTGIIDRAVHPMLSIDFSSFDASLIRELIYGAFDAVEAMFESRAKPQIRFVRDTLLNMRLLTPQGIMSGKRGAMPSGSAMTNLIDGFCQRIALIYIALRMGNQVEDHIVQGDDGVVTFKGNWDLEDVEAIALELNLKMSSDKGGVSEDRVYYLQNIHSSDFRVRGVCVRVRPIMRVLNGMMSYERLKEEWNSFDDTVRWWQQAEAAKYHPMFSNLVEFLYRHDRYSRTLDASQVIQRAGGLDAAKSALDQPQFPYGKESLDGINSFSVVRGLKRLRGRS